jgi:hypothetical protein
MKVLLSFALVLSYQTAIMAEENHDFECRAIVLNDEEYCSVSFYELLSDTREFSNRKIRMVGYLRQELDAVYLSPDLASIQGPVLSDNVIALTVSENFEETYREYDGTRVEIFGTFRHACTATMVRGHIKPVVHVEAR